MIIEIPISVGELIDKITILEIKSERIKHPGKLQNVNKELELLNDKIVNLNISNEIFDELKETNEKLWDIEDMLRQKEKKQEFDDEFIRLARGVYFTNDKRSDLKKSINLMYGSELHEEKEHVMYK